MSTRFFNAVLLPGQDIRSNVEVAREIEQVNTENIIEDLAKTAVICKKSSQEAEKLVNDPSCIGNRIRNILGAYAASVSTEGVVCLDALDFAVTGTSYERIFGSLLKECGLTTTEAGMLLYMARRAIQYDQTLSFIPCSVGTILKWYTLPPKTEKFIRRKYPIDFSFQDATDAPGLQEVCPLLVKPLREAIQHAVNEDGTVKVTELVDATQRTLFTIEQILALQVGGIKTDDAELSELQKIVYANAISACNPAVLFTEYSADLDEPMKVGDAQKIALYIIAQQMYAWQGKVVDDALANKPPHDRSLSYEMGYPAKSGYKMSIGDVVYMAVRKAGEGKTSISDPSRSHDLDSHFFAQTVERI